MRSSLTRPVYIALTIGLAAAAIGHADDRNLIAAKGARPNVLMVVDSSGSMARDLATDSVTFVAGGDDPHSKLYQVKNALARFVAAHPDFNLGFTFYERDNVEVAHHLFLYRMDPSQENASFSWIFRIGSDGTLHGYTSTQTEQLTPQTLLRFGPDAPLTGGHYDFVPLFGDNGTSMMSDWSRQNQVFVNGVKVPSNYSTVYFNGQAYTGQYRVDAWLNEPSSGAGYYYPAYAWNDAVRNAISSFQAIHDQWAPVVFDPTAPPSDRLAGWNQLVTGRAAVQSVLDANQIGLQQLTMTIRLRQCRDTGSGKWYIQDTTGECIDGAWQTVETITRTVSTAQGVTPQDLDPGDTTEGSYPAATVPNDYDSRGSLHSAFDFTNSCNGWEGVWQSTTKIPLVPIPSDGDPDLLSYIESYFRPQPQLQFFFPTRTDGYKYWPHFWDDQTGQVGMDDRGIWVTDRVLYGSGSTPLKNALNDSEQYFVQDVMVRDDPYKICRKNFIILLTDGLETCSSTNAACTTATDLGKKGIPVFVVGYGLGTSGNELACISDNSNGQLYLPNSVSELVDALNHIGQEISERSRGFAAPVVPSVQASTDQHAYIAAFLPLGGRSIWQGHLRAFNVNPLTGLPPLTADGLPDTSQALWDAGDQLVQLTSSARKIYFGLPASGIPETRAQFVYPNTPGTDREVLRNLINPSLTDSDLQTTINFIRGDRDQVAYGGQKLGDIFHSVPQVQGPPQCYPCYLSNLHGYRDDPGTSTPDDGFRFQNRHRRYVVWVGADDGTIHAFDAGIWDDTNQKYDIGTGKELAAWVPKAVMPTLDDLALKTYQKWTVDGTPTVADVWIDPNHTGTPSPDNRQWRSVLISGERRGGKSYVCLDITQPDAYDSNGVPQPSGRAPSCADNGTGCSGDWPAFMWEFTDTSDEDNNGAPDLGNTWSRPTVGFVNVAVTSGDTTTVEERSVAIFGGGNDPFGLSGKFVYIVDIETGKILFKTPTYGMVPGEIAAVDLNLDGFIERLYWGDTAGYLWRMDISQPGNLDPTTGRVTSWTPQPFFYAGYGQPFYMRPAVAIASYSQNNHPYLAVAIGSGNRDDIFELNSYPNTFFTVVDRENYSAVGTLTVANLKYLTSTGAPVAAASNYLTSPDYYGWDLVLGQFEKVNTSALIVNQNITFSTFTPDQNIIIVPDPTDPGSYLCKRQGDAKTYVVNFFNANPPAGSESRFVQHDASVAIATDPMIYLGADGSLHVAQTLDTRQFYQIIPPLSPPLRITSWKEE